MQGEIEKLKEALYNYYGALNEISTGLSGTKIPEKPSALVLLEQCESLGLPLYEGGLMNQPHIWLIEIGVVREIKHLFDTLRAREEAADAK